MMTERFYFDHAATTPLRPEAADAMLAQMRGVPANPSSVHAEGRAARLTLDRARARVAEVLGAAPREIVFTAGGSEADNLAILGVARVLRERGRHAVTVATEHHAVLHAFDALADDGWDVTILDVDAQGRVDPAAFAGALRADTALASVMLTNNEVGTIAPIAALAAMARERGVIFHTDAVQGAGYLPLDVRTLGVDLLALSAHKFGGPAGAGVLFVREGTPLSSLVHGGGQELGRRAGTEALAAIAGLTEALVLAERERTEVSTRLGAWRDCIIDTVMARIPEVRLNGAPGDGRLPNNVSLSFAGVPSDALLIGLDLEGIAASAGSACTAGALEPSHVIAALGVPSTYANGTLRLSLGRTTTARDVERLLDVLPRVVERIRQASITVV